MAVEWENGIPILTGESLLSDVPEYTQALAAASIMPVGAIIPFMGEEAPDYWLICDGSEYDPADLPELYAVNDDFHAPDTHGGVFRVPDLRGRSPIGPASGFGVAPNGPVTDMNLGQRHGDWRIHSHTHTFGLPQGAAYNSAPTQGGSQIGAPFTNDTPVTVMGGYLETGGPHFLSAGLGNNLMPSTTVSFIVYAGRSTVGITPIADMPPVTTRSMIEARLAEAGIGEEEIKMLKEQLATLKESHAK